MQDTIIHLSIAGAAFGTGGIAAALLLSIVRSSSYDDAWRDGYDAGQEDALDSPAIWRRKTNPASLTTRPAIPENDVAADAAIVGWAEEIKSNGRVEIPKDDIESTYMVPLAPMAEILAWLKVNFPSRTITLEAHTVTIS